MPDKDAIISNMHGFGTVTGVPSLPAGFRRVFRSVYVDTGEVGFHAVTGGSGPALLLVPGWPQNWYMWRELMMSLSAHFTVIAVDPRGMGLSDKPSDGFDASTPANDMFNLMDALGHKTFSLAGHDVGMWIAFAMATERPERIRRVALGEAIIPGVFPTPPAIPDDYESKKAIWQNVFNRMRGVNERLVEGREEAYFGFEFDNESADAMPAYAREFYIEMLRRVPGVLKGSFDYYRGMDASIPQYRALAEKGLRVPVLAFAAEYGCGNLVNEQLSKLATDCRTVFFKDCGHFIAEQQPQKLLDVFMDFFTHDKRDNPGSDNV